MFHLKELMFIANKTSCLRLNSPSLPPFSSPLLSLRNYWKLNRIVIANLFRLLRRKGRTLLLLVNNKFRHIYTDIRANRSWILIQIRAHIFMSILTIYRLVIVCYRVWHASKSREH